MARTIFLSLTLMLATLPMLVRAQTERVVTVPAGTYTFAQIVTQSGTATSPIRYRPATAGSVTIRGGVLRNVQHVILDGFTIDSRLGTDWPTRAIGVDVVASSDVQIANSEVIGPNDYFTGFNVRGEADCDESTYGMNASAGISSRADSHRITFSNVVVHGFYGAGALRGTDDRIVNSLFRNGFNGLSISSAKISIRDSVFWVHPNHLFALQGAGSVELINNLLVDGQDMVQAGPNWQGAQVLTLVHNTFYIPANKPCYGFSGVTIYNIKQSALIRDNILVNKQDGFINTSDATLSVLKSNHNLFYNYNRTTKEFKLKDQNVDIAYELWVSRTGLDMLSLAREAPQFTSPPQYEDWAAHPRGFRVPKTAAEARSWFVLKDGSPGKNRGSDGTDMGLTRVGGVVRTPVGTPQNLRIVPGL